MIAPHLRRRACTSTWRCATCSRDARVTVVVLGTIVVCCRGCFIGLARVLAYGAAPGVA